MSRNSTLKNLLNNLIFLLVYIFFITLSSIYIVIPPLLGVLFAKYMQSIKRRDINGILCVFVCCLFFEVEKSNRLGILFLLFILLSFIINKMKLILREEGYLFNLIYVFVPYFFYFFFLQTFFLFKGQIPIAIDFIVLWYLFCESIFVLWKK